jgi:hypothetical protein
MGLFWSGPTFIAHYFTGLLTEIPISDVVTPRGELPFLKKKKKKRGELPSL